MLRRQSERSRKTPKQMLNFRRKCKPTLAYFECVPHQTILRDLQKRTGKPVSVGAAVYLSGVIEYLVAEVFDIAHYNAVTREQRHTITPSAILKVFTDDEDFCQMYTKSKHAPLTQQWKTRVCRFLIHMSDRFSEFVYWWCGFINCY